MIDKMSAAVAEKPAHLSGVARKDAYPVSLPGIFDCRRFPPRKSESESSPTSHGMETI